MLQRWKNRCCKLELATSLTIGGAIIALPWNYALAQSKLVPDSTLGSESSVVTPTNINGLPSNQIDGGAKRGANLFHSFREFNIDEGRGAYFANPAGIENILSRVTGSNPSNIFGKLGVLGNANLFLINPNGIIFGPNASLNVGGSFVASTASSLKFADGTQFSATEPQTTPLLTVSVPSGLQFGGSTGSILNQSVAVDSNGTPVGLQVQLGKTLGLVGGDVTLDGGSLTAEAGRIELGSVAGPSLVSLTPTAQGWSLGYEGVQNFRDIRLSQQAIVDASGEGGGDIQVQGRRVTLTDGSQIDAFNRGARSGGTLAVNASESVELTGSVTTAIGEQFFSSLSTDTAGVGAAGDLRITTRRLLVQDGAFIAAGTGMGSQGKGGNLVVTASDAVELSGAVKTPARQVRSGLFAHTEGTGDAGNLTIATGQLIVQNGAQVAASAGIGSQGKGGNLVVTASSMELSGTSVDGEVSSGLFARTRGTGPAGNLTIATGQLVVRDKAQVTVGSVGSESGDAGNLEVSARSIRLDNLGAIVADTESGKGGNITLRSQDLLLLRHGGKISTTAGAGGNGGNITINTPSIVAVPAENSDITANANSGKGGFIQITAQGVFGIERREQLTPLSDITAFSQQNPELNGVIEINTLGINPNLGLVNLPVEPVDVTGLVAQGCPADVGPRASKFVITGRGGLPPTPREALRSEPALADLGTPVQSQENHASAATYTKTTRTEAAPIVEATGWVTNAKGEVELVATAPTVTFNIPWLMPTTCHAP